MPLNLVYKYVAMMLMVVEANFVCSKTGLSPGRQLTEGDVRPGGHVGPSELKHFSGSIVTDHYFFGFGKGHLANFRQRGFIPQNSDQAVRERNLELAKFSSLIDTNGAYQLATNWLAALAVDVRTLEAKYRLNFVQWRYYPEGTGGKIIWLPVYTVEWRGNILRSQPKRESTVVSVTIFGATKELVEYHVLDDSLFLRPRIEIREPEKLLAISDEEFRKFDALQRSNLVARFAGRVEDKPVPQPGRPLATQAPVGDKADPGLPGSHVETKPAEGRATNGASPRAIPGSLKEPVRMQLPQRDVHSLPPASPVKRQ